MVGQRCRFLGFSLPKVSRCARFAGSDGMIKPQKTRAFNGKREAVPGCAGPGRLLAGL
tara:strand:+ start:1853 stop:2026 length:174 start_codon:yes stop_codon:yes gene_type:complete